MMDKFITEIAIEVVVRFAVAIFIRIWKYIVRKIRKEK